MNIDVKQAVLNASTALGEFYSGQVLTGVQLEEVELSDDEKSWFITIGFYLEEPRPPMSPVSGPASALQQMFLRPEYKRQFKIFKVDTETGRVVSMKIRPIPA